MRLRFHPKPNPWRRVHFWLTIAWAVALVPSVVWWKNSIPWLVFMSVWANLAGHWASYQAARSEDD